MLYRREPLGLKHLRHFVLHEMQLVAARSTTLGINDIGPRSNARTGVLVAISATQNVFKRNFISDFMLHTPYPVSNIQLTN